MIIIIPTALLIIKNITTDKIVYGNFQSYMSPKVIKKLQEKYNVSFDYYETNGTIENRLSQNLLDVVTPTSYETISLIKNKLVKKIDWNKFGEIHFWDQNENNFKSKVFTSATEALSLFTSATQTILTSTDFNDDGINDNLLDYTIPYFLQEMVFSYRGDIIPELEDGLDWESILRIYSNNRNNSIKLGIIEDKRSIYSIANLIQSQNIDVNPKPDQSISNMISTYNEMSNSMNKIEHFFFNSDSNVILNKLANNELDSAILYNGDALASFEGGDLETEIDPNTFHIVKPKKTLIALDTICINEKIEAKKESEIYKIIKEVALNFSNPISDNLVFENFSYVQYTPTLNNFTQYLNSNNFNGLTNNELNILNIEKVPEGSIEKSISKLMKSNLEFAFLNFKNKLPS